MKDVYEHLNDIDMGVSQFEEVEVSEAEREKVKMDLKGKIRKPKPVKWRKMAVAASISIGISAASLFGLSYTSFAQEIPLLGNLFQLFNGDGLYGSYEENSESLAIAKEDKGINVTMNEVIFDGKALYMTYTIESEVDLGESPELTGIPTILDSPSMIYSTRHELLKSGENKYVGMTIADLLTEDQVDNGKFEFTIESIVPDSAVGTEEIKGNWAFNFELSATDNIEQIVDLSADSNGVDVIVKKVVYTPMSFLLHYDEELSNDLMQKWDFVRVDIIVKDDLGNVYTNKHNGGYSDSFTQLHHTNTFEKLNPEATKLIVTPVVQLLEADGTAANGSIYRNEGSNAAEEKFQLEDIVIEIEK
ncbi:DUF4179 domain-containing protein [Sporosarcina sp. Marseille-Q4063]|uniref:DUF4179 domain-containing protein n=1 Tax=Sporosarcina sp. Marseille-Q4063 TaxID=2810514 RepID=UPI001BAEB09E|nr:DUF4179 domain-containing protein [Sporosarcina sp. Marseille-Q4063]QUW23102.1 DUF4179 domain-containing protein [Sporosarcina sp. Marseille-Q4063]